MRTNNSRYCLGIILCRAPIKNRGPTAIRYLWFSILLSIIPQLLFGAAPNLQQQILPQNTNQLPLTLQYQQYPHPFSPYPPYQFPSLPRYPVPQPPIFQPHPKIHLDIFNYAESDATNTVQSSQQTTIEQQQATQQTTEQTTEVEQKTEQTNQQEQQQEQTQVQEQDQVQEQIQEQKQEQEQHQEQAQEQEQLQVQIQEVPPIPPPDSSCWITIFESYVKRCFCCAPLVSYLTLRMYLKHCHQRLYTKSQWSSWRSSLTNKQLKMIPLFRLVYDLVYEAHLRLLKWNKPFDHDMALYALLHQLKEERNFLWRFLYIITMIKKLHLSWFFPIYANDIKEIKRRIKRINYLDRALIGTIFIFNTSNAPEFLQYINAHKV